MSAGGFLGLIGFYAYENRYKDLIVEILQDNLTYLNLEGIDLYAFAEDFINDRGTYGVRGHFLALAYPVIRHASFLNIERAQVERFEYRVVSRFLLSTDFFANGAIEALPIRYVAFSNPYRRPCANPFAEITSQ